MTDPILAISTTDKIGRLYQRPGGGYSSSISGSKALSGLLSGELFPSITNCIGALNPSLEGYVAFMIGKSLRAGEDLQQAEKAHITYLHQTADRGTRVHLAIEDFINKGFADPDRLETLIETELYKTIPSYRALKEHDRTHNLLRRSNDLSYFEAFLNFCRRHKPRFISQEATVYGQTFSKRGYAGTTDFIAEIAGEIVVGDWKTTSKMKQSVGLQLAAVANAKEITTDFKTLKPMPKIDAVWAVQLKPDETFVAYKGYNDRQAWVNFQAARTVWDMIALEHNISGGPILEEIR